MILILPMLITYCLACEPIIDERSIYPTVGEYFQLEMTEIFSGQCNSYFCDRCTNEIKIFNSTEVIVENILNQNIISVTSNETHFAALSNYYLIIYKKENVSQEYQNLFELPENINCFNVIYTQPDTILLDCYQENQLIFLQFNEDNFINVYNSSSYLPQSTQMEVYFNYSSTMFLLYAQYYQTYSILTLLSNQNNNNYMFQNLSVCKYQNFNQFHSSYQFIYLLQNNTLYQMNINKYYKFIQLTDLFQFFIQSFSVYQSPQIQGSCDIIIGIYHNQFFRFSACYSNILYQSESTNSNFLNSKSIKSLSNNNYIIIFDQQNLQIIRNNYYFNILQTINITQNTQLIFNRFSNVLYLFQQNFLELQIRVPALIITNPDFTQNGTKIIISAYGNNETVQIKQSSTINIQILQEQDTQIYVQYQNRKLINFIPQEVNFLPQEEIYNYYYQIIDNYSGQLINIQLYQYNKTKYIGQFYQATKSFLYNISVEDYKFCFLSSQNQNENLISFFATNQQIVMKYCTNSINQDCINQQIFSSSSPIEQFQLAYNIIPYQYIFVAGIRINSNFINCIYFNNYQINQYYLHQINASDQFLLYLLTYEGLYILFSNQSINFYKNCTQSQVITIDQYLINKAFNQSENLSFIPTNITTNIQYSSSLLYINNQTNVIIITLINNQLIPISRIQSKNSQIIYGINLVNDRLILSFYNNQTLNFEVWNLFNIYQPYFEKNLFEINLYNLINIYSDNLFLYVRFNSTQLYIYNPALSQHSALLLNQTLTSLLMCSTAIFNSITSVNEQQKMFLQALQSILLINSQFYVIYPNNQLQFMINKTFQSDGLYPQVNYNTSISSYFSQQTLNESQQFFIFLYDFLKIFPQSLQVNYNYSNNITTILPISSQLSYCYDKNNICQNYSDSNLKCYFDQAYLINFIDNQIFYLAQNSSIYQYNGISFNQNCNFLQKTNGSNNSVNNCLASISHNQFIFAVCQNITSTYLIQFNFTNTSKPIQSQINNLYNHFSQVYEMQIVLNGIFFIAKQKNNQYQQIFVFDQNTNTTITLTKNNTDIQDFIVITTKFHFKQYYIVTYIKISSIHCLLIDSQFNISDYKPISLKSQIKFPEIKEIIFYSLTLISQQDNYMIALLTNNQVQYPLLVFHFYIEYYIDHINLSPMVEYQRLLPAFWINNGNEQIYLNLNVTFLNGYLIITNINIDEIQIQISIYSLEDYSNLQNNILSPILMQKQIVVANNDWISYQISFNKTSNLINYVFFYQTQQKKISQMILSINPKIQLECQFEPKSIECCSIGDNCTEIQIAQPKIILNLIFPAILMIFLLTILYRIVFQIWLNIKDEQEENVEL